MNYKIALLAVLCPLVSMCQPIKLKGKIVDEAGVGVAGATVAVRSKPVQVQTDAQGAFDLRAISIGDTLVVSAIGYLTETEVIDPFVRNVITIVLKRKTSVLDEAVVIAYGNTTRRYKTGSISRVDASEIDHQPVSNPISALEGRVPGLLISQTNGVPGSAFKIELRGRSSIAQGSDPLVIIDGVPFAPNNAPLNQLGSAASFNTDAGGLSPFNSISPSDIESIEVLKDADATAIYGSRGANGVILISTKKGRGGQTRVDLNAYRSFSRLTRTERLMDTRQYVAMRKEAFANDGATMTNVNAYDLLVFDTTRYTDYTKELIGGTAQATKLQASVSGGTNFFQFLLSGGYHRESTVFPGDMRDAKGSVHSRFGYHNLNNRFVAGFSATFGYDANSLSSNNIVTMLGLAPNTPAFFDAGGKLVWDYQGIALNNPYGSLQQPYEAKTENLVSALNLSYQLAPGLTLRADLGYNSVVTDEVRKIPSASLNPASGTISSASFGNNAFRNWSLEPQASYQVARKQWRMELLVGGAFQQGTNNSLQISGNDFPNDALLGSIGAAAAILSRSNSFSQYRYCAAFGRLAFRYRERWLLNVSGRRDGSSRFGTGRRFANFGAVGAGWIFSTEGFMQALPFISFGKLRGSYGTTGNDKIGDYQYLNTWGSVTAYNGSASLAPSALFNPAYGWEVNRKLEGAVDLGFFRDRVLVTVAYYRNRSGNQLLQYALPAQTGFNSIISNFPAEVENRGWEAEVQATVQIQSVSWKVSGNISFPNNTLRSFPGIETSSYSKLVVGEPLSVYGGYSFLGVDPLTGVYVFADKNGAPTSNPVAATDFIKNLGNLNPAFYGGLGNRFSYKGLELEFFFDYRKQPGVNYLYQVAAKIPGLTNVNVPVEAMDRWQKPGDVSVFPKYTQSTTSASFKSSAFFATQNSDGKYGDASFVRLKNVSLSFRLPAGILKRWKMEGLRIYLEGQNLFVLTKYRGADPETQNISTLPPLKTLAAGIQVSF